MSNVVAFPSAETLTEEERVIYNWQYGYMGDFASALMKAIYLADESNLELLSKSFPAHVSGYKRYARERGWWETVQKKTGCNMFVTYKFKHSDPVRDFDMGIDDSLDMKEYFDVMKSDGFTIQEVVETDRGRALVEMKLKKTIPCECCGGKMDYLSEDLGYGCRDKGCILHVGG